MMRPLGMMLAAACALSAWGSVAARSPELPAIVAQAPSGSTDSDRETYLQRALKPPVDPALKGKQLERRGTGFFVSAYDIVTNYHVIAACDHLSAEFGDGNAAPSVVSVTASDASLDLAALRGSLASASPASFERDLGRVDTSDLSIIGFPMHGLSRQTPTITPAKSKPEELAVTDRLLQFFGDIHPGNSGSPLLDEYGAVVGIVSREINTVGVYQKTHTVVKNVAFAIPNSVTLAFLDRHRIPHQLAAPQESLAADLRMQRYRQRVVHISCWH